MSILPQTPANNLLLRALLINKGLAWDGQPLDLLTKIGLLIPEVFQSRTRETLTFAPAVTFTIHRWVLETAFAHTRLLDIGAFDTSKLSWNLPGPLQLKHQLPRAHSNIPLRYSYSIWCWNPLAATNSLCRSLSLKIGLLYYFPLLSNFVMPININNRVETHTCVQNVHMCWIVTLSSGNGVTLSRWSHYKSTCTLNYSLQYRLALCLYTIRYKASTTKFIVPQFATLHPRKLLICIHEVPGCTLSAADPMRWIRNTMIHRVNKHAEDNSNRIVTRHVRNIFKTTSLHIMSSSKGLH